MGLLLENCFIKKNNIEKIKEVFRKEEKRVVLENALTASSLGEVDIKGVLKYLTKR